MAITQQKQRRQKNGSLKRPEAAKHTLISSKDLERMQKGFSSPEESILAARRELHKSFEEQQAAFRQKQEQEAKKIEEMSETDRLEAVKKAAIKAKAATQLEEERDEVKRMNQMMLYSKCVAIRDKQIEEKKDKVTQEIARQRVLDAEMEVERQKHLIAQKEVEALKFEQRRAGMAILEEQLQEQEDARQHLARLQRQEQVRIKQAIEKTKQDEAVAIEKRKQEGAALLQDVMAGNAAMIERKKAEKIREIAEEQRIAAFVKDRDAKALAILEEKTRLAKEAELEIARLRAQQEQAQDLQAQADALRAKRWQEAAARREREEEFKLSEKHKAESEAILQARKAQAASKILAQAAVAKAEQAEFQAVLGKLRSEEEHRRQQEVATKTAQKAHLESLQLQVEEKQRKALAAKLAAQEEGRVIKEKLEQERASIEAIRQKKLQELRNEGVPERYLAELARSKF